MATRKRTTSASSRSAAAADSSSAVPGAGAATFSASRYSSTSRRSAPLAAGAKVTAAVDSNCIVGSRNAEAKARHGNAQRALYRRARRCVPASNTTALCSTKARVRAEYSTAGREDRYATISDCIRVRSSSLFGSIAIRRLFFQIHLWTGLGLGIYLLMMGVTGAILVFEDEILASTNPQYYQQRDPAAPAAGIPALVDAVGARYPGSRIYRIYAPTTARGTYLVIVEREGRFITLFADAATARILGESPRVAPLAFAWEAHANLFGGHDGTHRQLRAGPHRVAAPAHGARPVVAPGRVHVARVVDESQSALVEPARLSRRGGLVVGALPRDVRVHRSALLLRPRLLPRARGRVAADATAVPVLDAARRWLAVAGTAAADGGQRARGRAGAAGVGHVSADVGQEPDPRDPGTPSGTSSDPITGSGTTPASTTSTSTSTAARSSPAGSCGTIRWRTRSGRGSFRSIAAISAVPASRRCGWWPAWRPACCFCWDS